MGRQSFAQSDGLVLSALGSQSLGPGSMFQMQVYISILSFLLHLSNQNLDTVIILWYIFHILWSFPSLAKYICRILDNIVIISIVIPLYVASKLSKGCQKMPVSSLQQRLATYPVSPSTSSDPPPSLLTLFRSSAQRVWTQACSPSRAAWRNLRLGMSPWRTTPNTIPFSLHLNPPRWVPWHWDACIWVVWHISSSCSSRSRRQHRRHSQKWTRQEWSHFPVSLGNQKLSYDDYKIVYSTDHLKDSTTCI